MKEEKYSKKEVENAKRVSILGYLASKGFKAGRHYPAYVLMSSPLRLDRTPSFKVDKKLNHWFDFGTRENGDVIELVKRLENKSFLQAVQILLEQSQSFSFHCADTYECIRESESPQILKVKSQVTNKALMDYLQFRRIPLELASLYLNEIYYRVNGKDYFALGFKNGSGGYEVRNKYFKGTLGPKDVTLINGQPMPRVYVCVFEGVLDFLSLLAYRGLSRPSLNVLILNSLSLVDRGLEYIRMHNWAYLYLDYDEAGRKASSRILKENYWNGQSETTDCSVFYGERGFKDFNEFWQSF